MPSLYIYDNGTRVDVPPSDPFKGFPPLAELPREPAALLDYLQRPPFTVDEPTPEAKIRAAYDSLTQLITTPATPEALRVAAYRAIALVPGVTLVPGTADVAGRTGLGVIWRSDTYTRVLVFDPTTYHLLGSSRLSPTGDVTLGEAVLAAGLADHLGQAP